MKNFMSTGNHPTVIRLDGISKTMISGRNGEGKSTIAEAIVYALFNKSYRGINKPQFLNATNNKDCLIEIDFSAYGIDYTVRRGLKPNIFEVIKAGVPMTAVAAARDQQKFFEEVILKTNYKIFTQVVLMGTASYVPFMQLSAYARREVVEKLLDIEILTAMNSVLKGRISSWHEKHEATNRRISELKIMISAKNQIIDNFESIQSSNKEKKTQEMKILAKRYTELKAELCSLEQRAHTFDVIADGLDSTTEKINELTSNMAILDHELKSIATKLNFISNNDVCDYCLQPIESHHKKERIKILKGDKTKIEEGVWTYKIQINDNLSEKKKRKEEFDGMLAMKKQISILSTQIESTLERGKQLKKELSETVADTAEHHKDDLQNFSTELALFHDQIINSVKERDIHELAAKLFKDSGIKSQIIKKYIPQINKIINKYLSLLDFSVLFEIDENFSEKIRSRFRDDFSYWSFSMGERQRIDLAVLFTWREIASLRNSLKTNLLFFDEIFDSSIDTTGIDNMMGIFDALPDFTNIFVISHRGDVFAEKFDRHISVAKNKGFSEYIES